MLTNYCAVSQECQTTPRRRWRAQKCVAALGVVAAHRRRLYHCATHPCYVTLAQGPRRASGENWAASDSRLVAPAQNQAPHSDSLLLAYTPASRLADFARTRCK